SVYVVNAVKNLISEAILGALLTGLMVLLFLKDWRSVIVVILTIPISVLSGVILLNLFGQTINIMTLSGFALAVGVLVDEATVTIENIHQHQEMGKRKAKAIWDACKEVAFPKLLILLCILAVFAPAFIMTGIPKSMFLPLSLAVGFSMISSFLLSQTFVPVLSNWLLKDHAHGEHQHEHTAQVKTSQAKGLLGKMFKKIRKEKEHPKEENAEKKLSGFDKFKHNYDILLQTIMNKKSRVIYIYLIVTVSLVALGFKLIGTDILPKSNGGQFQLRIRTPDGTRIERTETATRHVLDIISEEIGEENMEITSSYIGTTPSSYGSASIFIFTSGPHEAVIQVAIKEEHKVKMDKLKESLRERIKKQLPNLHISFEPVDLVEKVMSQGSPTPIEVSVAAKNIKEAHAFAKKILENMKEIEFLRDVQIAQPLNYPIIDIQVDRERAGQLGVTPREIAKSMVAATSSSRFTEKNLWLDNKKGVSYQVQVQIPEKDMASMEDMYVIPVKEGANHTTLADVATITESEMPGEYDRSGPNRLVTITANIYETDLGNANAAVEKAIADAGEPPRGIIVSLKGQVKLLSDTLSSLQTGLMIAIVVIFLLLSTNFQSFKVSLVILSTIPAVLSGGIFMLLLCGATLNLQSYMGLIMSVGVSVANAILMITNAESLRLELKDAKQAAIVAAGSRLRPILMTTIAMVAGMIPMASGLGEGGDQTAPLGQAVIGGLIASTFAALLILPNVFVMAQEKTDFKSVSLDPEDPQSEFYEKEVSVHS
ncbi:MAG TPA: efflux RND transporter permease subunit, partial [Cytophagaceae bacterium]|nr:efflux RND transporter permease subunit [Cytophagaceae bacterium]